MTPVRALIVDDEPLARERVRTLLASIDAVEVVGECRDGREAVAAIGTLAPDLVFLDVQMPEVDGFEVVARVGVDRMPAVIFVTAYDTYALRAFDVHALDYLHKPFDVERFEDAVARAVDLIRRGVVGPLRDQLAALLSDLPPQARPIERVLIRTRTRSYFVRMSEVDWIEAARNYVRLHAGGQPHLLRQTLSGLEPQLDPERFVRIHRSVIVNVDCIEALRPRLAGNYEVHLLDGTRLTLSRRFKNRLDRFLPSP